jgi:predicted RNase H-like HicB family nuclease
VAVQEESVTPWQKLCSAIRRIVRRFETERGDSHAEWTLTVRVGPDTLDGGWVAECPELPGCVSQGETREEALSNLSDAIAGVISLRLEQQLTATPDSDTLEELKVAVAS